ncbi:S9 family peptidase, partial [Steroidobacter sp.]|uniref:S9 family peptidase n=1 Tax=Steroidobacter sp. TaxID=1978227 RepID=UPI001A56DB3D
MPSIRRALPLTLSLLFAVPSIASEPGQVPLKERYERAAEMLPWRVERYVYGMSVQPQWSPDGSSVWFEEKSAQGTRYWQIDLRTLQKSALPAKPSKPEARALDPAWVPSPNGKWAVRRDGEQLTRVDLATGQQTKLTSDGVADYAYGRVPDSDIQSLSKLRNGLPDQPYGVWSPEGDRFVTYRVDERGLFKLPLIVPVVAGQAHQVPWVHFQNTAFRNSPKVQRADLVIFDMRDGSRVDLQIPQPLVFFEPTPKGGLRWSRDGKTVFAAPFNKDGETMTAYAADASTGKARALLTEPAEGEIASEKRFLSVDNGRELVVYSMRSDWGHLYLYDGRTGALKRQLTKGEWAVDDIRRIDDQGRWVYFSARGKERGRHPNNSHLYRVSLDGGSPVLLTPEDAQHDVQFSADGKWFVDTYSTIVTPPVSVLRSVDGKRSVELLRADISALKALGWKPPIPFTVKSVDGVTDLYGALFLPFDVDPSKSYPIVQPQYMGGLYAPRKFLDQNYLGAMSLAQVGFATMMFDGREAKFRSRKVQSVFDGKKATEPAFYDDHIGAMRQLAKRYPFIDVDRVGIYGNSDGGWRAARALLQHPEFYKVAVAVAGSHDYGTWIGTKYPTAEEPEFDWPTNMEIAGQL